MAQAGLYLFTGPDRDRKRRRLRELAEALHVDPLDRYDASALQLSASALLARVREHPVASPARLIVVDEAQRLDRICLKALEDYAEHVSQTACLILLVDGELSAQHPLASLKDRFVVERFTASSGGETSATGGRQAGGFALVEAIARRDVGGAFQAIEQQRAAGKEVVELLGLLAWQLQRWLTVSQLVRVGALREQIERTTGLQAWQLDRLMREIRSRPVEWLQLALRRCWELDIEAKTGRTIPRTALEGLVMELCAPISVAGRMAGSTQAVSPVAA